MLHIFIRADCLVFWVMDVDIRAERILEVFLEGNIADVHTAVLEVVSRARFKIMDAM